MYADLHCHSDVSDGTDSPAELVKLAHDNEVSVIALTDHDSVVGLPQLLAAADDWHIN